MRAGVDGGAVDRAVLAAGEEEARVAFEDGGAAYMRNWPYAAALLRRGSFGVVALPAFEGADAASVLAGHVVVVAAEPADPDAALALADYLTGPEAVRRAARRAGLAPPLVESWVDRSAVGRLPGGLELQKTIEQARPRPVTPAYTSRVGGDLPQRPRGAAGAGVSQGGTPAGRPRDRAGAGRLRLTYGLPYPRPEGPTGESTRSLGVRVDPPLRRCICHRPRRSGEAIT